MTSTPIATLKEQLIQAASASRDEECRLGAEANEAYAKAKRLREEADLLELHSERLHKKSNDANRLCCSLKFEALCLSLRHNEAETTTLPDSSNYPVGYAAALGDALDHNTHVTSVDIGLDRSIFPLRRHSSHCKEEIEDHVSPLVDFLKTSNSLRFVTIDDPHGDSDAQCFLARMLLGACFQNPSIEILHTVFHRLPSDAFSLCNASSGLKSIMLHVSEDFTEHLYSRQERVTIGNGFQALSCLKKVYIESTDHSVLGAIVAGMGRGDCNLDKLTIVGLRDESTSAPSLLLWPSLSALLHSKETMNHLSLSKFEFVAQDMGELINGLKRLDGSISVTKLSLHGCCFDSDAVRLLRVFMQTRVDVPTGSAFLLRELAMDLDVFGTALSSAALLGVLCKQQEQGADTLIGAEGRWHSTLGSQLQLLSVSLGRFPSFLKRLARNAHRIGLTSLTLSGLRSAIPLTDCMSRIASLRNISVNSRLNDISVRRIVLALRENGTLQSFSLYAHDKWLKLVTAYCERNQFLDELLRGATRAESDRDSDTDRKVKMSFGLALLEAAKQVPSTRASKFLLSLLVLEDSIGVA